MCKHYKSKEIAKHKKKEEKDAISIENGHCIGSPAKLPSHKCVYLKRPLT